MENLTTNSYVSAIKLHGYKVEITTNIKGQLVAKYYKMLTVGKNKGQYKFIEGYYFTSEEKRQIWVKGIIAQIKLNAEDKQARKDKKAEVMNNFINPFTVGQILYDSWGYDQTNIDFFKVVGIKDKSVIMRRIAQNVVDGSEGFMCENVTPAIDTFISDEFTRPVKVTIYDNKPSYRVNGHNSYRGSLFNYTAGAKGIYQSHYA